MLTRKSSKVRVVKPPKCPCNCAFPHDATKQASTRTLIESKQKENSPNLQKTDKMKKKSTKTGQTKPPETLQNTKQAETSTRLSRNKARTQNTKTSKNTSKSNENLLPEEVIKSKPSKTPLQDAKQAETSPKLSRNKARTQTKPSKTLQNTKQAETSTKLSRNKAPTHSKSNENLVRKAQFNNNSMQSQSVVKKCYVLLHQLPEDVIKTKLAQKATGKGKQRLQKCDTLSKAPLKGVTRSKNEGPQISANANEGPQISANPKNLPIPLQHKVGRNVAIDAMISQKKPKKSIPSSKLRKRKTMNYAESSLEMSMSGDQPSEKPKENRVPIYKLNVNNETETKPHEDTYEFDSSDCEKRAKKKRRKVDDSSSDEYNKTIQGILRNIAKRVRKRKNGILPKKRQNNVIKARAEPSKQKTAPQPILDKDCNKNILEKNVESDDDGVDNSDFTHCFGFKEKIPKVKILSDIHFKPNNEMNLSLATPTKFRESRPNANSTMIGNVLTPWRFNDINIKRNPHFITLKESSLPCISQEMVLDHTIVDKFGDHSKLDATNQGIGQDIRKTPVQKRVTDYFVCDSMKKTNGEDKENLQVSLFDSDMFSPIKSTNQFTRVESVKRKILGDKTDNNVQVSTPITQNVSVVQSPILEEPDGSNKENRSQVSNSNRNGSDKDNTYFGFDSESDDQVTPQKNKIEKPFRLSVNVSDRKYTRKPKQTRKLLKKVEPVVSSDDESDTSVPEEHNGEYRLFDDFDDTFDGDTIQEPGIIKKKRTRRRLNDDGQNAYHQRRKDMRTKEEEEEAEKWAKAFNSLCEEIEEFPLEIE